MISPSSELMFGDAISHPFVCHRVLCFRDQHCGFDAQLENSVSQEIKTTSENAEVEPTQSLVSTAQSIDSVE
jgi:hypothetical protein